MLTADRPQMAGRAVRSFLAQDYENKTLLIYDTGARALSEDFPQYACYPPTGGHWPIIYVRDTGEQLPLCELMNHITELAIEILKPSLIAKWDDDDVSDRRRLTQQRATLFQSGREVVGYYDMPFVMPDRSVRIYSNPNPTYSLGTSLMYTPEAWKACPFPDTTADPVKRGRSADTAFVHHHASKGRLLGVSSMVNPARPMMVATIHQGNTTAKLEACVPLAVPETADAVLRFYDQA